MRDHPCMSDHPCTDPTFVTSTTEQLFCLFASLEAPLGPFPSPQFEKEPWGWLLKDFDVMTSGFAVFL